MTLTVGILDTLIRGDSQSFSRCFQVLAAPSLARLQMISLCPFVPRIDEDERISRNLGALARLHAAHDLTQPRPVELRSRANQNVRVTLFSWAIVPTGAHTRAPGIGRNRSRPPILYH